MLDVFRILIRKPVIILGMIGANVYQLFQKKKHLLKDAFLGRDTNMIK